MNLTGMHLVSLTQVACANNEHTVALPNVIPTMLINERIFWDFQAKSQKP